MPQVISAAAAAVLASVGGPAGMVSLAASTGAVVGFASVQMGLNALARAQLPDPQSVTLTKRMSRPPRSVFMGLPSRCAGAYGGAVR